MDRRYWATNHYPLVKIEKHYSNAIFLRVLKAPINSEMSMSLFNFCNQWYLKHYPILKKQITNQIAHQIYDHVRNDIV